MGFMSISATDLPRGLKHICLTPDLGKAFVDFNNLDLDQQPCHFLLSELKHPEGGQSTNWSRLLLSGNNINRFYALRARPAGTKSIAEEIQDG
ncbi:hypothetical protein ElyMa_004807800 [Elysia marginata]|uniref:Uncharacterized protein n=1 Tax=Elysia marginata TaxID=1093978 RepID=A0AAV4IN49_9GAST|nr:hypothetical protein ElyMa_004807800 [Elysia marginata]